MKILVTGAAGFIGYHTARALLDLADREGMAELFRREGFQRVIHLAAQAGGAPLLPDRPLQLGVEAEKRYLPLQPGDVPETHSDISDLARDTGYRPQVSVKAGVQRFVEWYRWFYGV